MTVPQFLSDWNSPSPYITVKTSGSTGTPKQLRVEKSRMRASARMTCDFLNLNPGDTALLCMSVDYIAGKMMVVRALERGLDLIIREPSGHPLALESKPLDFAAMVPLQVYNSLQNPIERQRLSQIKNLIIGGGAIDTRMEDELRSFPGNIFSTYGMTETLSHIAMRKISGSDASLWYKTLPGVTVFRTSEGCLGVDAPAILPEKIVTNDLVEMKNDTFRVVGRRDFVICSGGIKISPEEIERVLAPKMTVNFAISKRKDDRFGEVVVLVTEGGDLQNLKQICEQNLPPYHRPKQYIILSQIPRTETNKIARKRLEDLIKA